MLIAGPNGAGKSTLLRCLAGLARPTRGEVRIGGRTLVPADVHARRSIGYVAHATFLHNDLTLHENLAFAARLYGLPAPAHAAGEALTAAGLATHARELPHALSRGMQQRAAIARALLHRPDVLLLDEPFTGLDAVAAGTLRATLAAAAGNRQAVLIVTHHPEEAWDLATRTVLLAGGQVILDAPKQGTAADFARLLDGQAHG